MASPYDRRSEIDEEEARREHRATIVHDFLIERFPEYRVAPDWWDTSPHGQEEHCFRLDGEKETLEVRVTRELMVDERHRAEEITERLLDWDPSVHKRVRVTAKGLVPF